MIIRTPCLHPDLMKNPLTLTSMMDQPQLILTPPPMFHKCHQPLVTRTEYGGLLLTYAGSRWSVSEGVGVILKRLTTELRNSIKVCSEEHFKCRGNYVMCRRRWDEKDSLRMVESLQTFLKPTLGF